MGCQPNHWVSYLVTVPRLGLNVWIHDSSGFFLVFNQQNVLYSSLQKQTTILMENLQNW